jgi:hypothetical protein
MDKAEFLRQEYVALRAEMAETRRRIHRLAAGALLLLPAALLLASRPGFLVVALFVPVAAASASLLLLSEGMALMRCGRYIKVYIEHGIEGVVGWEHWLETRDAAAPRNADRLLAALLHGLFLLHYLAGAFLAVDALRAAFTLATVAAAAAFYVLAGVAYLWLLLRSVRLSLGTGAEDVCLKALLVRPHCIFGREGD